MKCISSVRAIWWNTVQYFEIGQSVVDRGRWYCYSRETVEAEKYHRQENKYRRQIQRWGQHDWLAEKNTEIGKVKVGKIIPTFFLLLSKREKNYYSCGCAKLTFPPAPCFCLGKSILNLNFFNLGKSHCKQKGWNKSSVSPRLDFDCGTLREILHNWNFYFSRLMLPLFSDIL